MPVLSKPSVIAQKIHSQDFMIYDILRCFKKHIYNARCFHGMRVRKKYTYESLNVHQNLYDSMRLVLCSDKSQALADYFMKGHYPQKKELRWLCDHYQWMYKNIE